MSNKIKDMEVRNNTYYFFDDIFKHFDLSNLKIHESHAKII